MFNIQLSKFFDDFGTHRNMVLSTSYQDKVSSRMMSIVESMINFISRLTGISENIRK